MKARLDDMVHLRGFAQLTTGGLYNQVLMTHVSLAAALVVFLIAIPTLRAEDWTRFRGPSGQGHSDEQGIPFEWSETEHVVWKTDVVGRGWSSPVISDGRIWLTTAVPAAGGGGSLRLLAFDTETGQQQVDVEVFRTRERESSNPKNSLASPTAVVDAERDQVYVHFGASGTAALTTSGEKVWERRFDYITQHGNGGSPMLYGDLVILSGDGYDKAFIVALDAATGDMRWRVDRSEPVSQAYSTPVVIDVDGEDQLISITAFRTTAHDPRTGEEIWQVDYPDGFSNVPGPVYSADLKMVYIATGFQQPSLLAVRADGSGNVTDSHVEWKLRRGAPLTPSPIVVGDELYVVSDTGIATCLDAKTGQRHWRERLGGNYSASPVFADGRIYFQSEEGTTTVIAPGTMYQELARNELDGRILATIAVSDGAIYLRTDRRLYRIGK